MRNTCLILPLLLLAACEKPAAPPEPLRPVKTMQVGLAASDNGLSLPGEVRARYETPLGFQVGGKITECKVNLGDTVHRDQVLARLEPADYQLNEQAGAAGEAAARSALTLAEADLKRYRELREKGFVSAAALEQKQTSYDAARATLDTMQATHSAQSRKVDYTALTVDGNGVVSGYDCNPGQVVAAGQPVMKLARIGEKEILLHLPESELQSVRKGGGYTVSLNAIADKTWQGSLRELAAAADPATRTYAARIAVKNADDAMQLGMSATVRLNFPGSEAMRLPLSAVVSKDSHPSVWKVDQEGVVHAAPIAVAGIEGDEVLVASGLNAGDTVVTAGVNLLRDGEKVKLVP